MDETDRRGERWEEIAHEIRCEFDPTLTDFTAWVRETQVPTEPVTAGVLSVLFEDFMREHGSEDEGTSRPSPVWGLH